MNESATALPPRTPMARRIALGRHARVGAMGLALAMLVSACSGPLPTGGADPAGSAPPASTNAAASTRVIAFAGDQSVPDDLDDAVAVSAGDHHSLAVREDGTVRGWGLDDFGEATVPQGLTNVTAIEAGDYHSLALRGDGTVVAWGSNETDGTPTGQSTVPDGLTDVKSIAAGGYHSLALKNDGTVVAWGNNRSGQTTVPDGLSDVTAISAGFNFSLALTSNGAIVAWGNNQSGQLDVPPNLPRVTAIAAGRSHSLALKSDGTVIAWGESVVAPPYAPEQLSNLAAISADDYTNLALRKDGTVAGWPAWLLDDGQPVDVPDDLAGVTAISAGGWQSLAVTVSEPASTSSNPATAGIRDLAEFRSPSGVGCNIEAGATDSIPAVACFVPEPEYPAQAFTDEGLSEVDCPGGLFLTLAVYSNYTLTCADDEPSTETPVETLEPGALTRAGGFLCIVESDAIACRYEENGFRFRIGNQSFDAYQG